MKNEILRQLSDTGFPWVAINEKDSKDYKTFLCLSSAIREIEHLKGKGKDYKLIPTEEEAKR
jgi:hypothetical protein